MLAYFFCEGSGVGVVGGFVRLSFPHLASQPLREYWKVHLAMFTIYLDDSGTDPSQPVAIASALIIPAPRIIALEREWYKLRTTAYQERDGLTSLKTDFSLDPIRSDPRFAELVRKVGLPQ
jgi:hypothetical protein